MDVARERAPAYIRALPARDRVMLVRADALATPATALRARPPQTGRRAIARLAARLHRAQPGPGARLRARHSVAGRAAAPARSSLSAPAASRERESTAPAPALPRNLRVAPGAGRGGELRAAQDRPAPLGLRPRTLGDLRGRAQLRHARRARLTLALEFGPSRGERRRRGRRRAPPGAPARRRDGESPSSTARAPPGVLDAQPAPRTTHSPATITPSSNCPRSPRCRSRSTPTSRTCCGPCWPPTRACRPVYRAPAEYRAGRPRPGDPRPLHAPPRRRPPIPSGSIRRPRALPSPCASASPTCRFRAGTRATRSAAGLRAKDFKLEAASVFEARRDRYPDRRGGRRPGDRGAARQTEDRGARASTPRSPCVTNSPRRCCSPTCCGGWRRRSFAAGS